MTSSVVYVSLVDHINKRPYLLLAPLHYTRLPSVVMDNIIAPIYDIEDKSSVGRCRFTIADMVDMRDNDISFTILDHNDVIEIKQHIDAYVLELSRYSDNEIASAYLPKIQKLQSEINTSARKLIRNRKIRTTLKVSDNILQDILDGIDRTEQPYWSDVYVSQTK